MDEEERIERTINELEKLDPFFVAVLIQHFLRTGWPVHR